MEDGNTPMTKTENFEDLEAWKLARELTNTVYRFCRNEPLPRDFGMCDQIRRASESIMNNLAEGWESLHQAEKRQFYNFARRSCGEVRSMSYVLDDNSLVAAGEALQLRSRCIQTGKLITGLLRSIKNRIE